MGDGEQSQVDETRAPISQFAGNQEGLLLLLSFATELDISCLAPRRVSSSRVESTNAHLIVVFIAPLIVVIFLGLHPSLSSHRMGASERAPNFN